MHAVCSADMRLIVLLVLLIGGPHRLLEMTTRSDILRTYQFWNSAFSGPRNMIPTLVAWWIEQ